MLGHVPLCGSGGIGHKSTPATAGLKHSAGNSDIQNGQPSFVDWAIVWMMATSSLLVEVKKLEGPVAAFIATMQAVSELGQRQGKREVGEVSASGWSGAARVALRDDIACLVVLLDLLYSK